MKAFFQNWLPWISSRLTRIDRKVPTFTCLVESGNMLNGEPYRILFFVAHHGPMYGVHHTFGTN